MPTYGPLYGPLSPLQYSHLYPLWPSVPSTAHYPLYGPLFPHQSSVPLRPSILSTALYPLYGPLSALWPSVSSTALCPLYCPLSLLQPFVPSMNLFPLFGPLKNSERSEMTPLVCEMFCKIRFVKTSTILMIYFVYAITTIIALMVIIAQAKYIIRNNQEIVIIRIW